MLIEVERRKDIPMQLTKKDIIQKLYNIEQQENIKLGREVQKVIRNEVIPMDIIKLINKYDKNFLQIYDTFNTIYISRNKNPLYRNLRNKDLIIPEKAIALSSFVTKVLISCSKIPDEQERELYATAMNIDAINNALTEYSLNNNAEPLLDCMSQIRDLILLLYCE